MKFDNSYSRLPKKFYSPSTPFLFEHPTLIAMNQDLAQHLGLDYAHFSQQELAEIFSGQKKHAGSEFISTVYAAHQFGHFVPMLGDGRAILIGEVIAKDGQRYDIQLKGAGPTSYSRRGDGFSALGPVLREYAVSEFMHAMKIPTTRALAAVATNLPVYRESVLPGGIFTRVAQGHIRIGTFQYFSAQQDTENLRILLQYSLCRHYPEILDEEKDKKEHALSFLRKVIHAQVDLVSSWMSIGFIHGVMNTDNMSISGETIDYGPCAFMDHFNFNQVYSFIDRHGRYSYMNQAKILEWNLARLADALIPLIQEDYSLDRTETIRLLEKELSAISRQFEENFLKKFSQKLALDTSSSISSEDKKDLVSDFLNLLHMKKIDFTLSFRKLAKALREGQREEELQDFFLRWSTFLKAHQVDLKMAAQKMDALNPLYIPRNHLVERMIKAAVQHSDYSLFLEMNEVLKNPFDEQAKFEAYSTPPSSQEVVAHTFCGT